MHIMSQQARSHSTLTARRRAYCPNLESLETRLPLGDAVLGVVLGAWFVGPSLAAPQFGGAAPEGVDWPSSQLGRSSRAFFSGRQETDTRALSVLFVSAPEPSANAAGRHPTGMLEEPATIPSAGAVPTLLDREGEMGVFAKRHELGRQPSPEAARDP